MGKPKNEPPTVELGIDVIKRLLKLARAGKCGAVYCDDFKLRLGVGPRAYGKSEWISWPAAIALADTWVEPKQVKSKPVSRAKRSARLPIAAVPEARRNQNNGKWSTKRA